MGDLFAPSHLLLIAIVALLVLGPKRLPEVGRSIGQALREFKQGFNPTQEQDRSGEGPSKP